MALLPMLLYRDFLEPRSRILDLDPILNRRQIYPLRDSSSVIKADKNTFKVCLDVQQFAPEELSVTSCNNMIKVEGKHEEKEDAHGYISRHFIRKYKLPKGHDVENVKSSLSSDGVLTIFSRKRKHNCEEEREIPIIMTGPSKPTLTNGIENQQNGKEDDDKPEVKKAKK